MMNQSSVVGMVIMMTILLLHSLASPARHQRALTVGDVETMLRLVLQIHTPRSQSPSSDNRPVSPASNTGTSGTDCECGRGGEVLNTRTAKIIVLPVANVCQWPYG